MPIRNRAARAKRAEQQQQRALQDITEAVTKPGATPRRTIDYPSSLPPSSPLPASTPSRIVSSDVEAEIEDDIENIPILPFKLGEHESPDPAVDDRENPFIDSVFSPGPANEDEGQLLVPDSEPEDIDMTLSDPFGFVAVERKVRAQRAEKPPSQVKSAPAPPQLAQLQLSSTSLSQLTPIHTDSPDAGPSTSAKRSHPSAEDETRDISRSSSPPPPPKRQRRTTRKQTTADSSEPVKKRTMPPRNARKKRDKAQEEDEDDSDTGGSEAEIEQELTRRPPASRSSKAKSPAKKSAPTSRSRSRKAPQKAPISESESSSEEEEEPPQRVTRSSTAAKKKPPSSNSRKKETIGMKRKGDTNAAPVRRPQRKVSDKAKSKAKEIELPEDDSEDDGREQVARQRQERIEYFKRLEGYKMHQENVYVV